MTGVGETVGGGATGCFVSSDLVLCDTHVCLKAAQYQGLEQEKNTRVAEGLGNIQTHKTVYDLKRSLLDAFILSNSASAFHVSFKIEEGSSVKRFDPGETLPSGGRNCVLPIAATWCSEALYKIVFS